MTYAVPRRKMLSLNTGLEGTTTGNLPPQIGGTFYFKIPLLLISIAKPTLGTKRAYLSIGNADTGGSLSNLYKRKKPKNITSFLLEIFCLLCCIKK